MKPLMNVKDIAQRAQSCLLNMLLALWLSLSVSATWAQPQLCTKEPSPKQPDYRVVQLICDPGPENMPYRYGNAIKLSPPE